MRIETRTLKINGVMKKVDVTIQEKGDIQKLKDLYIRWKNLNGDLKSISTRGINLPEVISENAFCLFSKNCLRVTKVAGEKCSYDCINTITGSRIQVKATSVSSDLTSFGPRSEWDELFFLDFSKGDGSFKIYKIEPEWIYKFKVNKKQSFQDQQDEARRPRFSIIEGIIKPHNLKPIAECKL